MYVKVKCSNMDRLRNKIGMAMYRIKASLNSNKMPNEKIYFNLAANINKKRDIGRLSIVNGKYYIPVFRNGKSIVEGIVEFVGYTRSDNLPIFKIFENGDNAKYYNTLAKNEQLKEALEIPTLSYYVLGGFNDVEVYPTVLKLHEESESFTTKTIDDKIIFGDIVTLKSGGPVMTLSNFNVRGKYMCNWFVDNESFVGYFTINQLKKIDENSTIFN